MIVRAIREINEIEVRQMSELQQSEARLAKLIEDMSGSIHAEIHAELTALETKMDAGFDRVEAATRRNTVTLAGGASAIAALDRWRPGGTPPIENAITPSTNWKSA